MIVRPLTASDLAAARDLVHQLGYDVAAAEFGQRFDRIAASPDHFIAAADLGGELVGLVHAFQRAALEKPCEAVIQALVVRDTCRRSGVGRGLMCAAEQWAAARDLTHVVLHTRIDRAAARLFYESLGYEISATSDLMRKSLGCRTSGYD